MLPNESLTFVVPVSKTDILENNFLSSPCLRGAQNHQILIQKHFPSAGTAFNDAISRSVNDLIAFVHQDMIFPRSWLSDVGRAIQSLDAADPRWGVLGCWGACQWGGYQGHIYSNGLGVLGASFERPVPVQTLDETVLILRKSSGLRFDEGFPHFHLHGADICLEAARKGRISYAISAFCTHNNYPYTILPEEFYECYSHLKTKWKEQLPIQTPCMRITRFDLPMYQRRLREVYLRYIRRKESIGMRARDVSGLLREVDKSIEKASAAN